MGRNGEAGECVFIRLLKAEKLYDGGIDIGVKAETAFIGANGAVELNPIAVIGVGDPTVVYPWD